jgi:DNA-binding NtrC family response regulator
MSKTPVKILILDDDPDVLLAARLLLKPHFKFIQCESDPRQLPCLMDQDKWDIILLDMNFSPGNNSGIEGMTLLDQILERDPAAVVVMMTAYGDLDTAVDAIRRGATDFVLKPWQNEKMLATITAASRLSESRGEVNRLKIQQQEIARASVGGGSIIGWQSCTHRGQCSDSG